MTKLPKQVVSLNPPTIFQTGVQRFAVFGGGWFVIDNETTLDDLYKVWVRWEPKHKPTTPGVNPKTGASGFIWKAASSKPGKFYEVSFRNGVWNCQCSGFGFRRDCRHVNEMKQKHGKH